MNPILRNVLIGLALALLALIGIGAWLWHGHPTDRLIAASTGAQPQLVDPEPERFPTLGLAKAVGWGAGEAPVAAAGLVVNRFAEGLQHPRTMLTLPNGDVLVAETNRPAADGGGLAEWIKGLVFARVGAGGASPDRLVLLRDANRDGVAEQRHVLRAGLASPSGLAWADGKLYVANHDAVLAFDYQPGATALTGTPARLMALPPAGNHWMRNLQLSSDGKLLYVAVGSASNIGESGMAQEAGRAAIWEINLATGRRRPYANGLRNPNGMDWNPATDELWTVVQERDQLGGDLVPDYLTNIPIGAQYGWPWVYWKDKEDDRVEEPMPDFLTEYTRRPEYALGAHTAALGLRFAAAGNRLGPLFANGAFVARHGSWNRKPLSGYDVIFVTFDANGNPRGMPVTVLGGFLRDQKQARGRPTWLTFDGTGALLVSDDTAGVIWRVIDPKAAPAAAVKPVKVDRMPPQQELSDDPESSYLRPEGFKDP